MQARVGVIGAGKYGVLLLKIFSQLERENKIELVAFARVNGNLYAVPTIC